MSRTRASGNPSPSSAAPEGDDTPLPEDQQLAIIYRPVNELIPYAKNARTHSEDQLRQIRASMLEFGWTNPVLLDGEHLILAGHGRVTEAAKIWSEGGSIKRTKHGMIPCIDLHGLSAAQKSAYVLADNKIPQNAGWDKALLAMEINDLREIGYDVALTGFQDDDLAKAMSGGKSSGVTEVDVHQLTDRFWISIRGPVRSQAKALKAMREACAGIDGVEVEMGTIDGF